MFSMDDLVVLVPLHIRSLVILKSVMFIDFANLNRNTLVPRWGKEDRLQKRKLYQFSFHF
jgi:hypothetical protein